MAKVPSSTEFVVEVKQPIFEIGAKPGDDVLVRPGDAWPVTIVRCVAPEYGALAAALADGRATIRGTESSTGLHILTSLASSTPRPAKVARKAAARVLHLTASQFMGGQ